LELTEDKFEDLCQGLVKTAVNQIALISSQGKLVEKEIEREIRKMVPDPDSLRYRDKWKFWKKMPEKEVVNRVKEKVLARDGVVPSKIVFTGGACKIRCLRNKLMSTYAGSTFIFREKELVAKGAAIKAGIIKGICKDTLVLECISKSIGLVLQGGVYDKIIHKNTTIPTKKTKTFTTTEDNQKYINISVFEGEHEIVSSNRKVIDLKCGPLLPAKAGIPKVKVVFDVDASNVLRVVAEDMGTGKSLEVVDSDAPYTHLDSKMKKKIKDLLENWSSKV
jgi:molecular chaperone DnaK (HSP70)